MGTTRRRSPRRLLGVLAATATAFTLFAAAPTAGAADTTGTATATTRSADTAARTLSTSTPVVFVHGYTGNAS
ncbi:lipase, partial [Streptomyces sp. NPDC059786]